MYKISPFSCYRLKFLERGIKSIVRYHYLILFVTKKG